MGRSCGSNRQKQFRFRECNIYFDPSSQIYLNLVIFYQSKDYVDFNYLMIRRLTWNCSESSFALARLQGGLPRPSLTLRCENLPPAFGVGQMSTIFIISTDAIGKSGCERTTVFVVNGGAVGAQADQVDVFVGVGVGPSEQGVFHRTFIHDTK